MSNYTLGCITQKYIWALLNMNNFKFIIIWPFSLCTFYNAPFVYIYSKCKLFKIIYDTYQIDLKKMHTVGKIALFLCLYWLRFPPLVKIPGRQKLTSISTMRSCHIRCNTPSLPRGGASAQRVYRAAYLRQPVVFLSTRDEWNFSLWSSSKVELLHPEWGMITVLVRVVKASRMIVIFTASQDDRFHSTPAETRAREHPVTSAVKST